MRALVVIAHHGSKNRSHLLRMIETFSSMDHEVDVVALCEEPKSLPATVEQIVGLPTADPRSLPFGHRKIMAERAADYDLFIYSEDDTLIEQRHIDCFVELQQALPDDHISGFMRFEVAPDGERSYCTVHSHYRWLPESVCTWGGLTFAYFTNEHAACFALTRLQLEKAIASGGFLIPPHQGRYDMLESAATDVYTRCGLRKVLCLERIEDQLVHHLPNVYLGKLGVGADQFHAYIDALQEIAIGEPPSEPVMTPETRLATPFWDRHSFPRVSDVLVRALNTQPRQILTVGATSGDLELALMEAGHEVQAVPVDEVFRAGLIARGVPTAPPHLAADDGDPQSGYDVILMLDLLPFLPEPAAALRSASSRLASHGRIVATAPDHPRYAMRNLVRPGKRVPLPTDFASAGMHRTSRQVLSRWLAAAELQTVYLHRHSANRRDVIGARTQLSAALGNSLVAVARSRRERGRRERA